MSGSTRSRKKRHVGPGEDHLDLVPLIDCVFLLLLFFMLCGRLSTDQRTEQITVPPTKTSQKITEEKDWKRVVINVFGNTRTSVANAPSRNSIGLMAGGWKKVWVSNADENFAGYIGMRAEMNSIFDKAEKFDDPNAAAGTTPMKLPKVIVEIRADSDTEYRVVQEIQMVLTDSVTIDPKEGLKGRDPNAGGTIRPFVNIDYTSRPPGGP